jgi:hypothetical protein
MLRDGENLNIQEPIFEIFFKKSPKIRLLPAAMSVCFHVTIRELSNGFSWGFAFESFLDICRRMSISTQDDRKYRYL